MAKFDQKISDSKRAEVSQPDFRTLKPIENPVFIFYIIKLMSYRCILFLGYL